MYLEHCKNLLEVENGIKRVELDLRRYISIEDSKNEYTYTKILSQLITCWTEVRILKLIYEDRAFTQAEIDLIIPTRPARPATLENKWKKALEIAISKAYRLDVTLDIETQLSGDILLQYQDITKLITEDLVPLIEIRNRIAHGQWKFAFTSSLRNISTDLTAKISAENIVSLQLKQSILTGLALLIHDLAVSPPTFQRDFQRNYNKIKSNKENLHKRSYSDYKRIMIEKYKRGQTKKNSNEKLIKEKFSLSQFFKSLFS
jgi:hypothetical protein